MKKQKEKVSFSSDTRSKSTKSKSTTMTKKSTSSSSSSSSSPSSSSPSNKETTTTTTTVGSLAKSMQYASELCSNGRMAYQSQKYTKAIHDFGLAVRLLESCLGIHHLLVAKTYYWIGFIYHKHLHLQSQQQQPQQEDKEGEEEEKVNNDTDEAGSDADASSSSQRQRQTQQQIEVLYLLLSLQAFTKSARIRSTVIPNENNNNNSNNNNDQSVNSTTGGGKGANITINPIQEIKFAIQEVLQEIQIRYKDCVEDENDNDNGNDIIDNDAYNTTTTNTTWQQFKTMKRLILYNQDGVNKETHDNDNDGLYIKSLQESIRLEIKADHLLRQKLYGDAIQTYCQAFQTFPDTQQHGTIWTKLAFCYLQKNDSNGQSMAYYCYRQAYKIYMASQTMILAIEINCEKRNDDNIDGLHLSTPFTFKQLQLPTSHPDTQTTLQRLQDIVCGDSIDINANDIIITTFKETMERSVQYENNAEQTVWQYEWMIQSSSSNNHGIHVNHQCQQHFQQQQHGLLLLSQAKRYYKHCLALEQQQRQQRQQRQGHTSHQSSNVGIGKCDTVVSVLEESIDEIHRSMMMQSTAKKDIVTTSTIKETSIITDWKATCIALQNTIQCKDKIIVQLQQLLNEQQGTHINKEKDNREETYNKDTISKLETQLLKSNQQINTLLKEPEHNHKQIENMKQTINDDLQKPLNNTQQQEVSIHGQDNHRLLNQISIWQTKATESQSKLKDQVLDLSTQLMTKQSKIEELENLNDNLESKLEQSSSKVTRLEMSLSNAQHELNNTLHTLDNLQQQLDITKAQKDELVLLHQENGNKLNDTLRRVGELENELATKLSSKDSVEEKKLAEEEEEEEEEEEDKDSDLITARQMELKINKLIASRKNDNSKIRRLEREVSEWKDKYDNMLKQRQQLKNQLNVTQDELLELLGASKKAPTKENVIKDNNNLIAPIDHLKQMHREELDLLLNRLEEIETSRDELVTELSDTKVHMNFLMDEQVKSLTEQISSIESQYQAAVDELDIYGTEIPKLLEELIVEECSLAGTDPQMSQESTTGHHGEQTTDLISGLASQLGGEESRECTITQTLQSGSVEIQPPRSLEHSSLILKQIKTKVDSMKDVDERQKSTISTLQSQNDRAAKVIQELTNQLRLTNKSHQDLKHRFDKLFRLRQAPGKSAKNSTKKNSPTAEKSAKADLEETELKTTSSLLPNKKNENNVRVVDTSRNITTLSLQKVQRKFQSSNAIFVIRPPFQEPNSDSNVKHLLDIESYIIPIDKYISKFRLDDPTTIDIVGQCKHNKSIIYLSGKCNVVVRKSPEDKWIHYDKLDFSERPLGWVEYMSISSNSSERCLCCSLDQVLEEALVYRELFCRNALLHHEIEEKRTLNGISHHDIGAILFLLIAVAIYWFEFAVQRDIKE